MKKHILRKYRELLMKVGIVACSNGQPQSEDVNIEKLQSVLDANNIKTTYSQYIFAKDSVFNASAKQRADALMSMYLDDEITDIFDISGGDVANGILNFLDFEIIGRSSKRFWGYSDLTTIVNAIYAQTGRESILYQIKNVIHDQSGVDTTDLINIISGANSYLFDFDYDFVSGNHMSGTVIGGNIRCFLKLAGTKYMPDFTGKILVLESLGSGIAQVETHLSQLEQLDAFNKINGLVLGTFTSMEKQNAVPNVLTLLKNHVPNDLPIAVTKYIGHGVDSKAICIGGKLDL